MLLNCGAGEDSRIPWTAGRSNQSILKGINPEYLLEGLMLKLKLQYFGYLTWRGSSLEKTLMMGKIEGRRRRGWQRMRWLHGNHPHNGYAFEQTLGDSRRHGSQVWCSLWGCKEWDTIAWLMNNNWNTFLNNCGYIIHNSNAHFLTFFANDLLLAVYFIFILDYRNDVRQKANWSDFFIWVQNGL